MKQEKTYKKFKKKQQKLNLYIKLIAPNKHQNKICTKLSNNTKQYSSTENYTKPKWQHHIHNILVFRNSWGHSIIRTRSLFDTVSIFFSMNKERKHINLVTLSQIICKCHYIEFSYYIQAISCGHTNETLNILKPL